MAKIITPEELGLAQTNALNRQISRIMMSLLSLNKLNKLCNNSDNISGTTLIKQTLEKLKITVNKSGEQAKLTPNTGRLVVANLPHGILDVLVVISELSDLLPDTPLKILVNTPLATIEPLKQYTLGDGSESQITIIRKAVDFINKGGTLITFPATRVAGYSKSFPDVVDHQWETKYLKIAKFTNAPITPLFIFGRNSRKFLLTQMVSDKMSRLRLIRELLAKQDTDIAITIGKEIRYSEISKDSTKVANFIKATLYLLRERELNDTTIPTPIFINGSNTTTPNSHQFTTVREQTTNISRNPYYELYISDNAQAQAGQKSLIIIKENRILFTATLIISQNTSQTRDLLHSLFASHLHFDFSHNKLAHIIDNCIEVSNIEYSNLLDKDLTSSMLLEALGNAAKHIGVKYIMTPIHIESAETSNSYDIILKYLSSRRLGGIFSRYIIPRGSTHRTVSINNNLARYIASTEGITMLSKLIALTDNCEVNVEPFPRMMLDSDSEVASLGIEKRKGKGQKSNVLLVLEAGE